MGNACKCLVSFEDSEGVRHTAEVTAETLYEAAVLGIRAISLQWAEEPRLLTKIAVEVKAPAVRHELTFKCLKEWIDRPAGSPRDSLQRGRLKALLDGS